MSPIHAVVLSLLAITTLASAPGFAQTYTESRARDLGVPFDGTPGPLNAITDVSGVEVGYKTLISGEGRLVIGKGPVRTGVTAVLPRGTQGTKSVFAGIFAGNGNGDMTGTHWIEESGLLETPILITNTGSVGVVRDAAFAWMVQRKRTGHFWYPVAAETADLTLNDIKGSTLPRRTHGTRSTPLLADHCARAMSGVVPGWFAMVSKEAPEPRRASSTPRKAATRWGYSRSATMAGRINCEWQASLLPGKWILKSPASRSSSILRCSTMKENRHHCVIHA